MQDKYEHTTIEKAAQSHWTALDAYRVTEDKSKKKFYACSMLPYPSGKLHMGHVRNYTINDMMARQLRMQGYNVLMPMGWDAFGLPAENAAMKNNVPPAQWTYDNIAYMKKQMQAMGLAIDWSREMAACDPGYYQWNQWLFLKMLEKGIAYRKTQIVNWDPVDMTVLANEQVIDGKGWRTGAVVEKREIPGYYLKITDYAEELLSAVTNPSNPAYLSGWPDRVRAMQENWIGKSEGVRFAFPHDIQDAQGQLIQDGRMYVFTTRADTIMGVTFVAVAPEHPLAVRAGELQPALAAQIEALKAGGTTEAELAVKEKEGVATGLFVTHPLSGEKIEVWVGNYVLMSYGDGAVMGVPAHDERDFVFAKKYNLPIRQVVESGEVLAVKKAIQQGGMANGSGSHTNLENELVWLGFTDQEWKDNYAGKLGIIVNSSEYNGLGYKACVDTVAADLAAKNLGEKRITYRLRDWGVSRQRYWGTPIPIVHCAEHGAQPVPYDQLPVKLPEDCIPDGSGNPLLHHEGFHAGATCPICGKAARRETDTMDTFVDSSWYFMRYTLPQAEQQASQKMVSEATDYWMPGRAAAQDGTAPGMDQYIGGIEHAILHLLYARFWVKAMRDLGLTKVDEPFTKLLCQGMVLNHVYSRKNAKGGIEYFWPADVDNTHGPDGKINGAKLKSDGSAVDYGGVTTMSKSKNNGVDPQELIEKYGADTARLYTMFTAPPEATLEWNDASVEGSYRFLRRIWAFGVKLNAIKNIANKSIYIITSGQNQDKNTPQLGKAAKALRLQVHTVLKQIQYDYQRMQYNTVVSGTMKLLNALEDFKGDTQSDTQAGDHAVLAEGMGILLRVLYPATPHISHTLWQDLGYAAQMGDVLDAAWPSVDESALQQDERELMLQVNGKLRGSIVVPADANSEAIEAIALRSEAFLHQAHGAAPKKVIVVPGRLVNIVV